MIWITGAKGLLGGDLIDAVAAAGLPCVGTGHEVDVGDYAALSAFATGRKISWIVNCAAYTDVDGAEDEPETCFRANGQGPANLGRLAAGLGLPCIHLSTDYVFDGRLGRPYTEDDPVSPLGVYGKSKVEGEARLRAAHPSHVILRTSWVYGRHKPGFVGRVLESLRRSGSFFASDDQSGCPTSTATLLSAILTIIRSPSPRFGTFHCSDRGSASRLEEAELVLESATALGLVKEGCSVRRAAPGSLAAKAKRPPYSVLDSRKITEAYGIPIPDWKDSLKAAIKRMAEEGEGMAAHGA